MNIVFREYRPTPEKRNKDIRFSAERFQISGTYPDPASMNLEQKEDYFRYCLSKEIKPHIAVMERISKREYDEIMEKITETHNHGVQLDIWEANLTREDEGELEEAVLLLPRNQQYLEFCGMRIKMLIK